MSEPYELNVTEARRLLDSGDLHPVELTESCLERIGRTEDVVRAWVTIDGEGALLKARALSDKKERGPLWGLPLAVKDIIDVAGLPTTASSKVLAGNVAETDAPVVDRLRRAGAVILGKTNTQEFAYGVVTAPTSNPWNLERIPGGSSGGSAAAVAASHCPAALGSDTAGSIRIPSALCGVSGIKPRRGLLPLEGVIPLAPSLDAVGPIAHTAEDLRLLLSVMWGREIGRSNREIRVALMPEAALPELEPDVEKAYLEALVAVKSIAAGVHYAELPGISEFDMRTLVLMSEALEVHRSRGWWPARAADYTEETRSYLELSEGFQPEAVERARRELSLVAARFRSFLEQADLLITPTVQVEAPLHSEASRSGDGGPRRPAVAALTRIPGLINPTGLAAASIPCGFTLSGLPVGLHIVGESEELILDFAAAFQRETDWAERRPPLAG